MPKDYITELSIIIVGLLLSIVLIIPTIIYKLFWVYIPTPFILSIIIVVMKKICNYLKYPDTSRDNDYEYMTDT